MNAKLGWTLAIAAMVLATMLYGLQGFLAALSLTVFWLLLQFSRAMRVMRRAAERPKGRVGSVVMLQSKLKKGTPMLNVVAHAGTLGDKVEGGGDDVWAWADDGARLTLYFDNGTLSRWQLDRLDDGADPGAVAAGVTAGDGFAGPSGRAP